MLKPLWATEAATDLAGPYADRQAGTAPGELGRCLPCQRGPTRLNWSFRDCAAFVETVVGQSEEIDRSVR